MGQNPQFDVSAIMLLAHWALILCAGTDLVAVKLMICAGFGHCDYTGDGRDRQCTRFMIGVHSTKGCCTATTVALASIRTKFSRNITACWRIKYMKKYSHVYIRDGNMFSFLSWAMFTSILSGPWGHNTATKSAITKTEIVYNML